MREVFEDALAVHRLTRLATRDTLTEPVRARIFAKSPPTSTSWSYVLTCPWCASVWVAAGVVAARTVAPRAWTLAARVLAFSTVAGALEERL